MIGMANFVRRVYKLKRNSKDVIPKIEGEKDKDWIAMDLGNIALHIFSKKARAHYDLESLWCLGEEYEKRIKSKNDMEDVYKKYLNPEVPLGSIGYDAFVERNFENIREEEEKIPESSDQDNTQKSNL